MVSGTNSRFLQKGVALRSVYEMVEPNLIWMDYSKPIREAKADFIYSYNSANASSDSKKKTPPLAQMGAKFPEVDKSVKSVGSGLTESRGFQMRIRKETMNSTSAPNFIMDCYEYAGFLLAEKINTEIGRAHV